MTPSLAWLLALALRSTVVLAVALALASSLRRRRPGARHRLLTLTCICLLSLPVLPSVLPQWRLQLAPVTSDEAASSIREPLRLAHDVGPTRGAGAGATPPVGHGAPAGTGAQPDAPTTWRTLLSSVRAMAPSFGIAAAMLWLAGTLVSALGLARALSSERRSRAASQALGGSWPCLLDELRSTIGVSRTVRLLACPTAEAPMTHGWRRPSILLPSAAEGWSDERRRVVLQHELVHVARADALRHLLWRAAVALYWFNPLTRVAAREARLVAEHACDEAVVELGIRPSAYARHLLEIADSVSEVHRPTAHALAMVEHSQLARRLHMILDDRRLAGPGRAPAAVAVALLAGTVALVAGASPAGPATVATPGLPAAATVVAQAVAGAQPGTGSRNAAPHVCIARLGGSFSGSIHDGPGGEEWVGAEQGNFTLQQTLGGDRKLCARVVGGARFAEKDGSISDLPAGSSVSVETRGRSGSQVMRVTGGPGGPRYERWIDGVSRPVDEAARAWLADAFALVADYRAIGSIQGQVGGLQGEIGAVQGQLGGLQGEIGAVQGRIGGLQGGIGSIQGERGAMEGRIGSEQGRIGALQGRRSQASETENVGIDAEIAAHRAAIDKLRQEMRERRFDERIAEAEGALKADEAKARADIADIERRIVDLHADQKIADLNRKISELHADERIAEIERRMKPTIERLSNRIDHLRG